MANKKISALTALTGLASTDEVPIVDKSDTTDAASGTTKRVTWLTLITEMFASRFAADAGANDAYAATLNPAPSAYVTGEHYRFKANTANTGAATINFNSLGAKTIKKAAGGITTDLDDNDIRAGQWVDLVYDGTNMQMQSLLGNAPSAGATTLDGLSDVVISSPATDQVLKYNGSEWVNGSVPSASTFSADFDKYRLISAYARSNSTSSDTYGHGAIAAYADVSANADDADGPFIRRDTASSSGTQAGFDFNNGAMIQSRWLPKIITKLKTGSNIGDQRIWLGCLSISVGSAADDPTCHAFAFTYSTNRPDTKWQAYTNDNSGGGLISDTGVTVNTDTVYILAIDVVTASSINFYISSDNGVSYTLVANHTTNLPTSSVGMNFCMDLRNLTGAVRSIKHSFTHIRMR